MAGGGRSFLQQLTGTGGGGGGSKRWSKGSGREGWGERSLRQQMEGMMGCCCAGEGGVVLKKRVVVVIDHTYRAKHAVMWALTHVANKGDLLTLLHVVGPHQGGGGGGGRGGGLQRNASPQLAKSLGSLCKASKPEVEVEALVIQGPRLPTVLSQVKKLEASVLVLGQKDPSPFCCLFGSWYEDFVEQCINKAECLTLAVRKQSGGVGGYLVSTRWQKNFWLLA